MKISLLTLGTRGDIQPFVVLGKALKKRGHTITISTAANFSSFIESHGLDFVPVDADFQEILNSEEGKKMMSNPFSARKHLNRLIYPMIKDALNKFYSLAKESDLVLCHVKAMADYYADGVPGKIIRTNVVPAMEYTREFVNPIVSFLNLPSFLNRASYRLSDLGMKLMSKPINQFRDSIGLKEKSRKLNLPSIYGLSNYFLQRPKDYPDTSHFTGFWFDRSDAILDKEILDFIYAGESPMLFTLGSMPFKSKVQLVQLLNRLTEKLNIRLIVVKGWGLHDTSAFEDNKNIKVIEGAPYDKLMPHIRAAIHHGGIGTAAECMRAGKPFLTCPVLYPLGDQHFWGTVAYRKGIAVEPIPLKKMNESRFMDAVKELLRNEKLHENSTRMMENLKNEDGVANAIEIIEST